MRTPAVYSHIARLVAPPASVKPAEERRRYDRRRHRERRQLLLAKAQTPERRLGVEQRSGLDRRNAPFNPWKDPPPRTAAPRSKRKPRLGTIIDIYI